VLWLLLCVVSLTGCGVVSNPLVKDTFVTRDACEVNLSERVDLERIAFRVPEFWAQLKPCNGLEVMHDIERDVWALQASYAFRYNGIVAQTSAAHFSAGTFVHLIGREQPRPETWLPEARERWKQGDKGHRVDRQIERVRHGGLDCWRVVSQSYNRDTGVEAQSYGGVSYACWPDGDDAYPPISLSAGVRYVDERPLYDIDIDRDLLVPVLESLEVRELSPEAYAARKQAYLERQGERCKRIARRVRLDGDMNAYQYEQLLECGYDLDTLRPAAQP
jgi:hypothetical protein